MSVGNLFPRYRKQRPPRCCFLVFKLLQDAPNPGNHAKTLYCRSKSEVPPSTNKLRKFTKCKKMTSPNTRKLTKIKKIWKIAISKSTLKSRQTNIEKDTKKTPILNQKMVFSPSGLALLPALFPSGHGGLKDPGNDTIEAANRLQKTAIQYLVERYPQNTLSNGERTVLPPKGYSMKIRAHNEQVDSLYIWIASRISRN